MAINRDFLTADVATTIARRTLADFEFNDANSLAGYLPSQEVNDIEYEIDALDSTGAITAANWRAFGGATTSEHWQTKDYGGRGRLQPISRNFVLDEETRLRMRNDAGDAIKRKSAQLVERATKAIALEVNYQRANALAYGYVEINGSGGLRERVDFGRNPEYDAVASGLVTDEAVHPLELLSTLVEDYEEENGQRPGEILMTPKILAAIRRHPLIVREAIGIPAEQTTRNIATAGEVDNLLSLYGLPPIRMIGTNKVRKDDLDGTITGKVGAQYDSYLLPQDSVILTAGKGDASDPEGNIYGRTFWGATLSGDTEDFNLSGSGLGVPGIVAAVVEEGWPSALEVIADAIAMPVVFNPNLTMKFRVVDEIPRNTPSKDGVRL